MKFDDLPSNPVNTLSMTRNEYLAYSYEKQQLALLSLTNTSNFTEKERNVCLEKIRKLKRPYPGYLVYTDYFDKSTISHVYKARNWQIPPNSGDRGSRGISSRMRTKIMRACKRIEQATTENAVYLKGKCRFITLTYGYTAPNHLTAKTHLSTFFKAYKRKYDVLRYCWVSELQSRGAIHFHIALDTEQKIDLIWLMRTWSRIALGARFSQKPTTKDEMKLYLISGALCWATNVKLIDYPGRYMSKYLAKSVIDAAFDNDKDFNWIGGDRMACSHILNSELKPLSQSVHQIDSYDEFTHAVKEFAPPEGSLVRHQDYCSIFTFK
jgi:hypothetical protein